MATKFLYTLQVSDSSTDIFASDGTAAGTVDLGLQRFAYNVGQSNPSFILYKGKTEFVGSQTIGQSNLGGVGTTDGTPEGTTFAPISIVGGAFHPEGLAVVDGALLTYGSTDYTSSPMTSDELMVSLDGMTFSPLIGGLTVGEGGITTSGTVGYFDGDAAGVDAGLWRTDGTSAGTWAVQLPGVNLSPKDIISLGSGKAVFSNQDADGAYSLWVTDGTVAGTQQINIPGLGANILPSYGGASTGKYAVFSAVDVSGNISVWATDGTLAGTTELRVNGSAGNDIRTPLGYMSLGNKVIYDSGYGLWATDGKTNINLIGGETEYGVVSGNLVYFFDPILSPTSIYVTDGTVSGTRAISVPGLQYPNGSITPTSSGVVFTGADSSGATAFFYSDGTASGTGEVSGIVVPDGTTTGSLPVSSSTPPGASVITLPSGPQVYQAIAGDTVIGGTGPDTVIATAGQVTVTGAGNLTFFGGYGASSVFGGQGSDLIFGGSGGGHFVGGTAGNNVLVSQGASGSNTTLTGAGAGDQIFGSGAGNDVLVAGAGRESILGGGGSTTVQGGAAADVIFTGSGSTTVYGGTAAADTIVGGSGKLAVTSENGDAIFGGVGSLNVTGSSSGADSIVGGSGGMTITGRGGNMLVVASTGSTNVNMGNGASLVFTGGNTTVTGGTGSLQAILGSGKASIAEGAGASLYDVVNGSAGGNITINGFRPDVDQIDLYGYSPSQQTISEVGASTLISLSDGTKINVVGVTNLGGSLIG